MQTISQAEAEAPPSPPARRVSGRTLAFWGVALSVVALDQLTKTIVRATLDVGESWPDAGWILRIRNVTNSGAAFSSLQDQTVFLIVMTLVGLAAIYLYYRNPPFDHWISAVAIGMMLGGASGNLIDRIRVGRVTDFISFSHFPTFNVADSSISIGVTTIIIGYLLFGERPAEPEQEPAPVHEDAPSDG
jgi:signal peptidase II